MPNTLLTPTAVTRRSLAVLHQKLSFIGNINRQYDDTYRNGDANVKGKFGPNLLIRLPNEYTVRSGINMSAQDVSEQSTTLTVSTVKGVDMNFTSAELALDMQDFSARIIEPAMSVLAANIEADALSMYKSVYNLYDGDNVAFGFNSMASARQVLTDNLAPMDSMRCMVLNTSHATKFLVDTKGLFQDSAGVSKQYREGMIGRVAGFDHYENTLLLPHATGTAAKVTGYLVNGASQTGSTLAVKTGTTTFMAGDVITIGGVFRVHPETKVSTGVPQQFVVTANAGPSATSLSISPPIVVSGARQNVTASPANDAAITKVGAGASETLVQSLAFHRDAFAFVTADLPLPQGTDWARREVYDGISLSLVRDFSISDRSFPCRVDVLYGFKAIRPQLAVRIHNDG